jgi:hypothetical protein
MSKALNAVELVTGLTFEGVVAPDLMYFKTTLHSESTSPLCRT